MSFKLEFKLKQHTPIIHFQHDQDGATLRATELKPKLDQFIIKKLIGDLNRPKVSYSHAQEASEAFKAIALYNVGDKNQTGHFKPEWRNWLIGKGNNEHVALDYKVRIEDNDTRSINLRSYGNIRIITDVVNDKKAISSNDINCKIICFSDSLRNFIFNNLAEFFLIENFGTRGNKGWGCYYHESTNNWDQIKHLLLDNNYNAYVYNGSITINNRERNNNIYPFILKKWRALKSGINQYDRNGRQTEYKKSLLFKYLCENEIRWDKRWMKQKLNQLIEHGLLPESLQGNNAPNDCSIPTNNDPCDDENYDRNDWEDDPSLRYEYRFGRALLGLPEHIEFHAQRGYIYQVVVKNDDGIERFKSPITFKVFDDKLFAIAHQPILMFNQKFNFVVKKKKKPNSGGRPVEEGEPLPLKDGNEQPLYLKTPCTNEFHIYEFLNRFFSCIEFERLTSRNLDRM